MTKVLINMLNKVSDFSRYLINNLVIIHNKFRMSINPVRFVADIYQVYLNK